MSDDSGSKSGDVRDEKVARRDAREAVGRYHEHELSKLVERVADAIDGYRRGTHDVFAVDETIHRFSVAAKQLWSFRWAGGGSYQLHAAHVIEQMAAEQRAIDWWAEAGPRPRMGATPAPVDAGDDGLA